MTCIMSAGSVCSRCRSACWFISGATGQVLPERPWYAHHGLPVGNVQFREQPGLRHRVALNEIIVAILIEPGRAAAARVAAEETQRHDSSPGNVAACCHN